MPDRDCDSPTESRPGEPVCLERLIDRTATSSRRRFSFDWGPEPRVHTRPKPGRGGYLGAEKRGISRHGVTGVPNPPTSSIASAAVFRYSSLGSVAGVQWNFA